MPNETTQILYDTDYEKITESRSHLLGPCSLQQGHNRWIIHSLATLSVQDGETLHIKPVEAEFAQPLGLGV